MPALSRSPRLAIIAALVMTAGAAAIASWQPQPSADRPVRPEGRQPADGQRPQGEGRRGPRGGGDDVGSSMKAMGRALKQLHEQIGDKDKKDENIRLCSEFEKACAGAKAQVPPPPRDRSPWGDRSGGNQPGPAGAEKSKNAIVSPDQPQPAEPAQRPASGRQPRLEGQPEGGRPAAPVDPKRVEMFRGDLMKVLKQMIVVEEDLMADKFDAATADLAKVIALGEAGHKDLGIGDDKD